MHVQNQAESVGDRCFEANVRVERIVHLPVIGGSDMDTDMLDWLTEDAASTLTEALGQDLEQLVDEYGKYGADTSSRREAMAEVIRYGLHDRGWLVEATHPVYERVEDTTMLRFSWGYTTSRVFFADTYEQALTKAIAWGEADMAEARGSSD